MIRKLITLIAIGIFLLSSNSYAELSRVKTWVSGETLTHTDLNGEFSNILDNFLTGLSPLTGNLDFNSKEALNIVIEKLAADGTGVEGQVIYNTTDDHLKLKNDTAWTYILDVPALGTAGQCATTDGTDFSFAGMTTQGDIEYHNGTTRTRLAPGTSGYFLKTQGAAANPVWGAVSAHQASRASDAADRTTTSASLVDMTGMEITITTGANPVLIGFIGTLSHSAAIATQTMAVDLTIDGSVQGGSEGLVYFNSLGSSVPMNTSFVYQSAALSAASHTFKAQWKTSGATAKLEGVEAPTKMWVLELK